jgi:glycosyltransferase involved in cell wall biosynthesis
MLSKVDALVPITKIDEHEFKLLGCTKPLFTCITGVDVSLYQEKIEVKEKPKTIFYFGSMDWIPNQEAVKWFLDFCWDEIYKAVPDSKFIIAGKGIPLNFFHINKPNVLIVENVIDGKEFFLQHQVMIVPLWSGSGLRIKIIEGMSYGKAIVSTSIGAEGINYTHQKNILIADNPYDFIQSVIELLTKEDLCKNIQLEASKLALNQFDNLVVVSELVQFYKKLSHV